MSVEYLALLAEVLKANRSFVNRLVSMDLVPVRSSSRRDGFWIVCPQVGKNRCFWPVRPGNPSSTLRNPGGRLGSWPRRPAAGKSSCGSSRSYCCLKSSRSVRRIYALSKFAFAVEPPSGFTDGWPAVSSIGGRPSQEKVQWHWLADVRFPPRPPGSRIRDCQFRVAHEFNSISPRQRVLRLRQDRFQRRP